MIGYGGEEKSAINIKRVINHGYSVFLPFLSLFPSSLSCSFPSWSPLSLSSCVLFLSSLSFSPSLFLSPSLLVGRGADPAGLLGADPLALLFPRMRKAPSGVRCCVPASGRRGSLRVRASMRFRDRIISQYAA